MAESSRTTSALQIGTTALLALNAAVMLYVSGRIQLTREIDFLPDGNSTGAVLQLNGVTAYQRFAVACTSTGGLTKYPTCVTASPYSTTGALLDVAIDCGNTLVGMLMSGSFVKSNAATTFGAAVLRNVTVGSGGIRNRLSQTGSEVLWNPADKIRLHTTTASPNAASNCTMWVTSRDKSGS